MASCPPREPHHPREQHQDVLEVLEVGAEGVLEGPGPHSSTPAPHPALSSLPAGPETHCHWEPVPVALQRPELDVSHLPRAALW